MLADEVFVVAKFTHLPVLTVVANPVDGGTVSGGGTFEEGHSVTIQATTNSGWRFTGWTDTEGAPVPDSPNPYTFSMPATDATYTANFVKRVEITVLADPPEAGTVIGSGTYDYPGTALLTATSFSGYHFTGWSDNSTNNPYDLSVPETNATYTANFAPKTNVTVTLTSSTNPCGFKDPITFTATIMPSNATGTVQFKTNGVTFDTQTLSSGAATSATAAFLPRGTNRITAEYSGDGLYRSGTNALDQVVTNHPPQAATATYTLATVPSFKIVISNLATNWSDPDGDTNTLVSVNPGTSGGTVSFGGKYIYYSNPAMTADQFTYVISDGQGGTNTGTVNLLSSSGASSTNRTQNITGLVHNEDGSVTVGFAGIPGYTYWVQAATDAYDPQWETISTNVAGSNGLWIFTDTGAASHPQRFYRTFKP
jgi:uncharacterized repeat protein (TIGR02543 family)